MDIFSPLHRLAIEVDGPQHFIEYVDNNNKIGVSLATAMSRPICAVCCGSPTAHVVPLPVGLLVCQRKFACCLFCVRGLHVRPLVLTLTQAMPPFSTYL